MSKKLFVPGPIDVSEDVLEKMSTQVISHRGEDASKLQEDITKKLQKLFYTKNNILLSTSSGSGLMEGSIRSCTLKRAAVLSCGSFGDRWYQMGISNGVPADLFKVELGKAIEPEMVDKVLSTNKYDIIMVTHNETSTGIANPIKEIGEVIKKYDDIIYCVDTVSSAGGMKIEVDKSNIDIPSIIKEVNSWRNKKLYVISREWAYRGAKQSRIVVEKFLEDKSNSDGSINDYKFLCFDGKFRYLWVDTGRYSNFKRGWWDENLKPIKVRDNRPIMDPPIALPENINEMIKLSEKLSSGFPHARIDWYNIGGKIIFGEITFYSWSGYSVFDPDSFDFEMGKYFNINYK